MKQKRHEVIIELITTNNIETQEELLVHLNKQGFSTTQATISRDIRELNLIKISYNGTRQKYALKNNNDLGIINSYRQILENGIVSLEAAENIVVVKTVSGMAMAIGAAIDNLNIKGIVGCIAGDDTIFLAIKSIKMANSVIKTLNKIANN